MIPFEEWGPKRGIHLFRIDTGSVIGMPCPYGRKGDLLWVKEGFFLYGFYNKPTYKADFSEYQLGSLKCEHSSTGLRFGNWDFHWKSPLFMPKKYARIWLELTADPIPQRIQEITEEDADAEGFGGDFPHKVFPDIFFNDMGHLSIPECFGILFDTYNGPGTWDKNPWVWKLEFKRIEK
uniref:Uncharacterized protein n=1 Tax=viral metagenome TaxID=1070528 RepID=A0A6H1ZRR2_9ZZZZ